MDYRLLRESTSVESERFEYLLMQHATNAKPAAYLG